MKYLTRKEELLLLAVIKLRDAASLVSIREVLKVSTGEEWTVGNVYVALDKLDKAGLLSCSVGKPTRKRGGKAVKFYHLTKRGLQALERNRKVADLMWHEYHAVSPKKQETS